LPHFLIREAYYIQGVLLIQNAKLFTLITGTGGRAIKAKVWTKHGSYSALMPVPKEDLPKIKAAFSPIRHNFIGLDETDWQAFDDFAGQFLGKLSRHAVFALSLAVARASTDNDLWRICKTRSVFPRIAGTVVKGGDWAEFMVIPYRERDPLECYR
jgi:hypothetical protein